MEQALQERLMLRRGHLLGLVKDANTMLDSETGIPLIQASQMCLQLKTAIGALEKETFLYMDKCDDKGNLATPCTKVQMEAEEVLARLESLSQLTVTENKAPEQVSRLPKLELVKFNGDILKWTEFWDKFEANIDSRSLKDVDKLSYLLSSLEGAALETVEGLGATNSNYAIAVDVLQRRYGAKDKVVDAHYVAINQLNVAANIPSECRRNLNLIERHLRVLASYGENVNNNHLRVAISSKFPGSVLYQVKLLSKNSEITELRACLEKVITAMEQSDIPTPSSSTSAAMQEVTTEALHIVTKQHARRFKPRRQEPHKVNFTFNRKRKTSTSQGPETKKTRRECVFCQQEHFSDQCEKYRTSKERKDRLGNKCYVCFREGHTAIKCNRADTIKCFHCKKQHNSALCHKKFAAAKRESDIPFNSENNKVNNFLTNITSYLQTATAKLIHNNMAVPCRLLLDSGSQRSYLTTKMAKQLDLTINNEDQLVIFTFGSSTPKEMSSPSVEVRLVTKRGIQKELRVNLVPYITDRIPVPGWNADDINVDVCADDNSMGEGIDLLIGNDYYFSLIRNEHIKVQETLFLVNTDFGWIISGNYHEEQQENTLSIVTYCQCHEPGCSYFNEPDLPLRTIDMKFLWALESIGITDSPKTTREEEAVRHFNETVEYRDGRYEVKWPWIDYPPELPTNFGLAYGRLKSLLQRSNAETIKDYQEILQEQLKSGIIEIIESQPSKDNVPVHYLPHHIVKQDGKRGRIVYDASAKCNGQKSLNECLYRGPSMIEDMTALILQFRTGKIGITADVEKAFLQVGLQVSDREVTRFLWVKDPTKEPNENNLLYFRFCRVPFGVISSPFLLTATIRYHFSQTNQPLLKKIADKCYVDNLVRNAESLSEAKEVYKETREAFGELAMNIREWTSNSKEFMASIPESQRNKNLDCVKVLGLLWDLKDDTLRLKLNDNMLEKDVLQVKTKKDVLRMLARFYDPCGFIAPLILPAKLLFQELCMKKVKWDTIMPDDLREKWNSIIKNLQTTKSVMLPRHAGGDKESKYELHAFTDASKNSYASVVYLRTTTYNKTKVSFLMAKSRVTPIEDKEDLKIPRLELLGYLIGNRLLKYVRDNLDLPIQQAYLWTDSLIVLSWMKSNKLLPPFVSRRINEIKETKDVEFRYVNTNLNPADLATRPELWQQKKDLWLSGPTFLTQQQDCWPSIIKADEHTALLSAGEALDAVDGPEMVDKGYEGSHQYADVDMTDEHTPETHQHADVDMTDEHTPETHQHIEVDMTEDLTPHKDVDVLVKCNDEIIKLQKEYFPDEVAGKQTHLTRNLGLFLDVDGIIRCKGRMSNTNWTYDKKHPILIPRKCAFTNEIIRSTHETNYHVGVTHTLSIIRQKYWIPQGRAEVERVIRKCSQCVKYGGGPYQLPPTPALPAERVNYSKPFTYTGMDYFGPMFVSTETGKEKRWICLYTCLAIRAIHMEVVNNLTADECLLALRRFTASRGVPLKIVSDNALQFKLTSQVLSETYCKDNKIKWKFIPALAPWHGGFYERLVAIVKHCLKRTIDKHLLQDTQLLTVIKEVESVVNSRPLVRVGTELEHVLKPSDFLSMGKCLEFNLGLTSTGTDTKIDLIQGWKRGQIVLNEFKRMFEDQYLPSLRERYNNSYQQPRVKSHREPRLGDIVQIKDDGQKRCLWKVGKIVSLIQGSDGECRIARVRVGNSEFTRSIGHLYPLETDVAPVREVIRRTVIQQPEVTDPKVVNRENSVRITETMEHLEPILPEPSNPEQPEARDVSDLVDIPVVMDEAVGETAVVNEVPNEDEELGNRSHCGDDSVKGEPTRKKRDAAIKAKEKIAEWTRQLFVLL